MHVAIRFHLGDLDLVKVGNSRSSTSRSGGGCDGSGGFSGLAARDVSQQKMAGGPRVWEGGNSRSSIKAVFLGSGDGLAGLGDGSGFLGFSSLQPPLEQSGLVGSGLGLPQSGLPLPGFRSASSGLLASVSWSPLPLAACTESVLTELASDSRPPCHPATLAIASGPPCRRIYREHQVWAWDCHQA